MTRKLPLAIAIGALLPSVWAYGASEPGPDRTDSSMSSGAQTPASESSSQDSMAPSDQSQSSESSNMKSSMKSAASKTKQAAKDTALTSEVKAKLLADSDTSGLKIHVTTTRGIVTLAGHVKSAQEKSRAEEIARGVSGVKSVHNRLIMATS